MLKCPNCDCILRKNEGHFVPPSMGEEGFFICKKDLEDMARFPESIQKDYTVFRVKSGYCKSGGD